MLAEHRPVVAKTAVEQAPVIELEGLSKRYGSVSVLNALSMRVPAGGYFALGGASGAGKTTLLGILGLLETPTAGEYRFHGEPTSTLSDRQLSELRNRAFGFVFQQFSLVPSLSAWQNVARPLTFAGVPRREHKRRALELLDRLGLAARAEHKPSQLSGGEQQRVAIARALINDPEVILADEPTGNLPLEQWEPILDAFDLLHGAGKTIVLVTHNPEVANRASRVLWLRAGRLEEDEVRLPDHSRGTQRVLEGRLTVMVDAVPKEAGLRLQFLGPPRVLFKGERITIQPRQADILTMLAANPRGLTGEQLLLLVYGDDGRSGTLKAALSKLRRLMPIRSQPYRLAEGTIADFTRLEEALKAGDIGGAMSLYAGSLLPQSEAPGVVELRERLDSAIRHAVLASGNGERAFQLAEMLGDDLQLWEAAVGSLAEADPRRAIALARAEQVRREWG